MKHHVDMYLSILITLEKSLQDVALPNERMFIPFGSLYGELKSNYNVCVYICGGTYMYVCCLYILVSTLMYFFSRFLFGFGVMS